MWQQLLGSARFHWLLLDLDGELAAEAATRRCAACDRALHAANYPRKPRGGPSEAQSEATIRYSFCCSGRDCRKRMTPPSVRFLERRAYLSVTIVLAAVVVAGVTGARLRKLREELDLDRRTLERWRRWWQEEVSRTDWWRQVRGSLARPIPASTLPGGLLEQLDGRDHEDQLIAFLRLLRPLSQSVLMRSRFAVGS